MISCRLMMKYEIYFEIFGKKKHSLFANRTVRLHDEIPSTANDKEIGFGLGLVGFRAKVMFGSVLV